MLHAKVERLVQNGDFCTQIDKEFAVAHADANSDVLLPARRIGMHSGHTTDVWLRE